MSIRTPTLQRLLREHFSGTSPLVVRLEEGEALMQRIRQRIQDMRYVEANLQERHYSNRNDPNKYIGSFSIKDIESGSGWRDTTTFTLQLNPQKQLVIEHYGDSALISNLGEIASFVAACQEVVERDHAVVNRQQKVRDLKSQAIIAQVKKLAKEEKFDFYVESDSQKLSFIVQITEDRQVEIQVPYSKFQEVLPELRSAILALRELAKKDIKFKLKLEEKSSWRGWILHEEL